LVTPFAFAGRIVRLHIILSIKYFVCETVVKVLTSEQRGRNLSGVDPAPDGKFRTGPRRIGWRSAEP
jgi:hypothetical protein